MRCLLPLLIGLLFAGMAAAGQPPTSTLAILNASDGCIDVHLSIVSDDPSLPERWVELRQAVGGAFEVPPNRVEGHLTTGAATLGLNIQPGSADGHSHERLIDLTPLLVVLNRMHLPVLQVAVMLPDVEGPDCSLPPAERSPGARWYREEFRTDDPSAEIWLTLPPSWSAREPGDPRLLFVLLAVPLPVFAWAGLVRGWAARTRDDALSLVASYWRFHQLHVLATLVLWLAAFSLADVGPFVAGWFPGETAGARLLRWAMLYAVPPAIITLLAQAIARPALTKLQSLDWPGVEIYRQSGALHLLPYAALLCAVCGLTAYYEAGYLYTAVSLIFFGVVIYVIYAWALRRMFALTPNAVSTGELCDRVAQLAKKFRVAVPLVSLLPTGRTQLANAFAVPGQGVWLTESLLRNFSRREVDAIVAHELAHFRQFGRRQPVQHGPGFWLVYVVLVAAVMFYMLSDSTFSYVTGRGPTDVWRWVPLGCALLIVGLRLSVSATKRRNEYEADLHAVEETGEPAALITALARLHRLGGTPFDCTRLEEYFYSHPATTRRIAALARRGGLKKAEVAELVRDTEADADHYPIPATATEGGLVFSSAFRESYMNRMSWTIFAIDVLIPIVAAVLAAVLTEPGPAQLAVLAGGVVVTLVAYFGIVRRMRAAGQARLRRGLREKFRAEFGDLEAAGGAFVNFAPGDVPRIHESFGQWDVGYLLLGDRLVYVGEQVRFALDPDQIMDQRAGTGLPAWQRRDHVYITWRDPITSRAGTFRLWPGEVSRDGNAADLRQFEERLHAWRAGKIRGSTPDAFGGFGPPELGEVHGVSPKAVGKAQSFLYNLLYCELLAAGICVLLGLSFDPEDLAGGWYVLLVVAVTLVINILPYWVAKEPEPPVVTAAPSTP